MISIKDLDRSLCPFDPLPGLSRKMPNERHLMSKMQMIMTSKKRTIVGTGKTGDRVTQTGVKSGRAKPTKTAPAIIRSPKVACRINPPTATLSPSFTDHNKNCSTQTLANWSKPVENMTVTWQSVEEDVFKRFKKSIWAARAAKKRNNKRTSLRPSRKMIDAWPFRYIKKAPIAACTIRPLGKLSALLICPRRRR
jgi:hypothetical protein